MTDTTTGTAASTASGTATGTGDAAAATTRRVVVFGAGGAGLAMVLTACASYGAPAEPVAGPDQEPADEPIDEPADEPIDEFADEPAEDEPSSAAPKRRAGKALADTGDIPTGGGRVFEGQKVVVTQPSEGEFRAFSAVCTHQGCAVASVENGLIDCPCHGSKFKIEDGSVTQGPATKPLPEQQITVEGDQITLA